MSADGMTEAAPMPAVDPHKARVVLELKHDRAIATCRFDPSGELLFIGSEDDAIQMWRVETGEKTKLAGHDSWVRGFAFLKAMNGFVSSGYDGRLIFWSLGESPPREKNRIQGHRGWIRALAVSPDERFLATAGNDRVVRVWSAADLKLVAELTGHEHDIYSLAFHPGGAQLVSADYRGAVKIWDASNWQLVREFDARRMFAENKSNRGTGGGLRSLMFSSDGNRLVGSGVVGGDDPLGQNVKPGVIVFDWESGKDAILRSSGSEQGVAWGVLSHPTAGFVAAVSGGISAKHLYFWMPDKELPFHIVELPSAGRDTSLHPDGMQLAVALYDGRVQIYSLG